MVNKGVAFAQSSVYKGEKGPGDKKEILRGYKSTKKIP